jgi:hypothetical protein
MDVTEATAKYHEELRARVKEVQAELKKILGILGEEEVVLPPTPRPNNSNGKWTEERRRQQSRRMKRLHREGRFN